MLITNRWQPNCCRELEDKDAQEDTVLEVVLRRIDGYRVISGLVQAIKVRSYVASYLTAFLIASAC